MENEECCLNCKYFYSEQGEVDWVTEYYCSVDGCNKQISYFSNYTGRDTNMARIRLEKKCCCQFKPKANQHTDTLKQRYEQLEQVAKDLYDSAWCAWFLKTNDQMPEMDKKLKERVADSYLQNEREQLEALGVSLDD